MISALVLVAAAFVLFRLLGGVPHLRVRAQANAPNTTAKIDELTEYASKLRAGNNYNGAERVYMQILKLNHRHASTYSRLGTLYSAQRNYGDAIECFEIATQVSPSGPTFYNFGLALYENRELAKAVAAFEKAIMFEPSPQRYVGLAKAFNRVGDNAGMLSALERAAELEPHPRILELLADAYDADNRSEDAAATRAKMVAAKPKPARRKPRAKRAGSAKPRSRSKLEKTGT